MAKEEYTELEFDEWASIMAKAVPQDRGTVTMAELTRTKAERPKAVLFIPEDASLEDDLDIEVVGLSAAVLTAMASRRC